LREENPEVTRWADYLLKQAAVGDRLPTPVDELVRCAHLSISGSITLDQHHAGFFSHSFGLLQSALKKIVGMVDLRENTIYLKHNILPQRRSFVTLHEIGHVLLPWQRQMYLYVDDERTLAPNVQEQFEREANQFAADLLFQIDRFETEARDLPLSIHSPLSLARRYGASAHAALRRYVEHQQWACALLVVGHSSNRGRREIMPRVKCAIQSASFTQMFGERDWNTIAQQASSLLAGMSYPHRFPRGEYRMDTLNGYSALCSFEVFTNSYDVFVFIYPS
jgi:hypothetical protein